jgi:hypothetical protein
MPAFLRKRGKRRQWLLLGSKTPTQAESAWVGHLAVKIAISRPFAKR